MSIFCRSCMNSNSSKYVEFGSIMVNQISYRDYFNQCTQLKAEVGDGLPNVLCKACTHQLKAIYDFISIAKESDVRLRAAEYCQDKEDIIEDPLALNVSDDAVQIPNNLNAVKLSPKSDEEIYEDKSFDISCTENHNDEDEIKLNNEATEGKRSPNHTKNLKTSKESQIEKVLGKDTEPVPEIVKFSDDTAKCPHCDEIIDVKELPKHVRDMHPDKYRIEPEETDVSLPINNFNNDNGFYSCPYCDINFLKVVDMREHMRVKHEDKFGKEISFGGELLEECEVCHKKILNRNKKRHMESHVAPTKRNLVDYECAYCSEKFKVLRNLTHHEFSAHSSDQKNPCNECSFCLKKYFSYNALKNHIERVHLPRKTAQCSICGKIFKNTSILAMHRRLHREVQYKCSICHKGYQRGVDLQRHMAIHTGETYVCDICGKKLAKKSCLTQHMQIHQGFKEKCKFCQKEFFGKTSLIRHTQRQHIGLPYRCEICPNVGHERRARFAHHMIKAHNLYLNDEELNAIFTKNTGRTKSVKRKNEINNGK